MNETEWAQVRAYIENCKLSFEDVFFALSKCQRKKREAFGEVLPGGGPQMELPFMEGPGGL